jgi:hypothetical protein
MPPARLVVEPRAHATVPAMTSGSMGGGDGEVPAATTAAVPPPQARPIATARPAMGSLDRGHESRSSQPAPLGEVESVRTVMVQPRPESELSRIAAAAAAPVVEAAASARWSRPREVQFEALVPQGRESFPWTRRAPASRPTEAPDASDDAVPRPPAPPARSRVEEIGGPLPVVGDRRRPEAPAAPRLAASTLRPHPPGPHAAAYTMDRASEPARLTIERLDVEIINQPPPAPVSVAAPAPPVSPADMGDGLDRHHLGHAWLQL